MICYRCGSEVGKNEYCPYCETDLSIFQKAVRISNSYYNDGLQKANVRNLSGAVISLKQSLKFNKYNIEARNLLGLVYCEMGEVVEALSEWVISKNYQPENNRACFYLDSIQQNQTLLSSTNQTIKKYNQALVYCRQDSRDLAIIQLKKVLSLNPKLVKAHQLLALLYIQEDKLELAKKSLRNAGKIDTDNTTTLRYLKEVNARLKEQSKRKKPKTEEDLISYQSGNETIIMPKRFKDSSLGATLLYILAGLVIGVAVTCWLIVPNVKKEAQEDARQQLVETNDALSTNDQKIKKLEAQIAELEGQLSTATDASTQVQEKMDAYETLLNAYAAYIAQDMVKAGEELAKVDSEQLSVNGKSIYDTMSADVSQKYLKELYTTGYQQYSSGDYENAILNLKKVADEDMTFENGNAVYYLAQAYRKSGDAVSAAPFYQYIVENYPNTERAKTAKNYVEVRE